MDPAVDGEQDDMALEEELSRYNPALAVPVTSRLPIDSSALKEVSSSESDHLSRIKTNPYNKGWRRIVRNFTPSWFAATMGTGIVGILLDFIPFRARWLYYLSILFFALTVVIFLASFVASLLRYTIWPEIWTVMIQDPNNSLFLGCFPMGLATLIQLWTAICVPAWGEWALTFAWVWWMIDTIIAITVAVCLPILLMSSNPINTLERINAVQLLPIAAPIVACTTGAKIAKLLPNPDHALGTTITCYILWGMSVPLAAMILVIYYHRLALHKLPAREAIVSCFLPLGPLGFGGFGIMLLGSVARTLFPETGFLHPAAGDTAYIVGFFFALQMWAFGLMWLAFALATLWKSRPFPFNMGWWGFTFPLGVFSASTIQLGTEMPSIVFHVLGTIFSTCVIVLWIVVAAGTVKGAWSGKLFYAPCLANLPAEDQRPKEKKKEEIKKGGDENV